EPWVPAVVAKIGNPRVTEMVAVWLSSVTMRGVEITCASNEEFRNDNTVRTPSAFKKKVEGIRPLAVFSERPPLPMLLISDELLTVPPGVVVVTERPPGKVSVVVTGWPDE